MKHFFFLLSVFILILGGSAFAGDGPEGPFKYLNLNLSELHGKRLLLTESYDVLCPKDGQPRAEAILDSNLLKRIAKVRAVVKNIDEDLPSFLEFEEEIRAWEQYQHMREKYDAAARIQAEFEGVPKLVKVARSKVKKVKAEKPESAEKACVAVGELVERLNAIDLGPFAPVEEAPEATP